jgi:hypothetical protein
MKPPSHDLPAIIDEEAAGANPYRLCQRASFNFDEEACPINKNGKKS